MFLKLKQKAINVVKSIIFPILTSYLTYAQFGLLHPQEIAYLTLVSLMYTTL